jgi:hypothetical protein
MNTSDNFFTWYQLHKTISTSIKNSLVPTVHFTDLYKLIRFNLLMVAQFELSKLSQEMEFASKVVNSDFKICN